ncbi:MAG: transporter substrate-binding protein [Rhodospirillales bacterium]|nr:transporter substrate-binding protein [Rhodospirillales bacterium]
MHSWPRRLGLAIAAVLACSSWQAAHAQSATPAKAAIRLDWKGGAQHAPFYLAKARGYYASEGIDLDIVSGSGSSDVVKQVGSKAVEFGVADALVLVQAAEQRVPVTAIAAYYQRTPIVVISPQAKPVTDPRQLTQGVKLGSKKGSATFQGLTALLAANDIAMNQVTLIDIGFGVQPLLVKQVDALMGFSMNEPIEAEGAGMPVTTMAIADHGVDAYGLMLVANSDLIAKNPALVKSFLMATAHGMSDAIADPAAAVAAVTKAVSESDPAHETKVLARTIPYFQNEDKASQAAGWQSEARWGHTIEVAKKLGLVERDLPAQQLFSNDLLPR